MKSLNKSSQIYLLLIKGLIVVLFIIKSVITIRSDNRNPEKKWN